jgi:hypothetical protein
VTRCDDDSVRRVVMAHWNMPTLRGKATQIGRDPRKMTEAELNAGGHYKRPLLAAIHMEKRTRRRRHEIEAETAAGKSGARV